MELAGIPVTEVAKEIRFHRRAGEERSVDPGVVETRHWPAIESQGAGCQHEVRALQRTVPQGDVLQHALRQIGEPRFGVGVWKQLWQLLIEVDVHAENRGD